MARTPKDITDAELAVLELLWSAGASPMRAITDALYPDGTVSDYATAQKLCERLEAKGFVARDRRHRPHRFRAVVDREELVGRQLRTVAERLCEGSYMPLINHLTDSGSLSAEEIRALRERVAELDGRRRGGRKR